MIKNAVKLLLSVFWLPLCTDAQILSPMTTTLSGCIVDARECQPIQNVNVYSKGGYGTTSNENGYFELPCHLDDVVYFSCVGYQKVTFPVPDSLIGRNRVIGILMSADTIMLGEVVVLPKIDFERIEYEVTHLPPDVEKQVATVNVSEAINTALTTSATYSDEGPENQLSAYTMRLEYAGMIPPDKSFTFIGTNSGIVRYLMVSREQKRRVEQSHTKYSPSKQKQLQMIEDVRKFVEDKSEN